MSYNYALSKILPTFATFTNEFSPFSSLSPTLLFIPLRIHPSVRLCSFPSRAPSLPSPHSSLSLLPPPQQPTCENTQLSSPPSLSCIPPEGRLSSFPISSLLSLSALSLVPPRLPDSFYRSSANSHRGRVTRPLRRTLSRHLSTLSARMEGNFATYLPTPTPLCQIQPRGCGASVSPPRYQGGADQIITRRRKRRITAVKR